MHNEVLREVGVLVLVNKDITEKLLVLLQHVRVVTQHEVGVEQQVVKVHRSGDAATLPVGSVYVHDFGAHGIAVGINEALVTGIIVGCD